MSKKLPVEIVISAVDEVTYKVMAINEKLKAFTQPIGKLGQAFKDLANESGISNVGEKIGAVGSNFRSFLGEAVKGVAITGALAYGLFRAVESTSEFASQIGDTADRLGITTKNLQVYQFAAEQVGVSAEVVEKSLNRMTKAVEESANGQGEAAGIFRGFGIQLRDSHGQIRNMQDILPDFADKFAAIKNPVLQNAIAIKLFGREGTRFASILKDGRAGLAAFQAQAEQNGAIVGDDTIKKLHAFDDGIMALTRQFNVFKADVLVNLFPELMGVLTMASDFLKENKQAVSDWAKEFVKELPGYITAIGALLKGIGAAARIAGEFFNALSSIVGSTNATLLILGATIFGSTIKAFFTLAISIGQLAIAAFPMLITVLGTVISTIWSLTAAIFAIPGVGWILAIISGIIALGVVVYKFRHEIADAFVSLWDGAQDAFMSFYNFVSEKITALLNLLPDRLKASFGFGASGLPAGVASGAPVGGAAIGQAAMAGTPAPIASDSKVTIDFLNMPRGVRTAVDSSGGDVEMNRGMGMLL